MSERSNIILSSLDFKRINKCIAEAKQNRTINDFEIQRLTYELSVAEIREPRLIPDDIVTMNSVVSFTFLNYPKQAHVKIVYPHEANLKEWKISIFSQMANALLGHKVGDVIEWIGPAGEMSMRIDKIAYQPEAAGHFDL